ncbi:MAG: polymerase subunit sigma-24 [Rariglobus sp.]|jgi:RNA polymerase sigma-70 factor (ECF subfamily)|nr:polymerase subunit sigma-24 [Rariglobus sp.]
MNASVREADDARLITQAVAGCPEAFTELFNRYHPMIHAFAYRLSLCPGEAADIAQDTFIQAARSLATFRRESSFKGWLYTIATNKGRDRYRQRIRRERLTTDYTLLETGAHDVISDEAIIVREALAGLPPDLREAVTLIYYEGMNHADASRVLGCAETTVSWRIFRAKQRLKKQLRLSSVRKSPSP